MERTDPVISFQISVYSLDGNIREAVHSYLDALDAAGLDRDTGTMSTVVWGKADALWKGLRSAYEVVSQSHKVVVHIGMSNIAPLPARAAGRR